MVDILLMILLAIVVFFATAVGSILVTRDDVQQKAGFDVVTSKTTAVLVMVIFFLMLPQALTMNVLFSAGYFFLLVLAQLYLRVQTWKFGRSVVSFLLCCAGVFFLPQNMTLIQSVPYPIVYGVLSLTAFLIMNLVRACDRAPWVTVVTVLIQCVLFLLAMMLQLLPIELARPLFLSSVAVLAVLGAVRAWTGACCLGDLSATALGFMLGMVWAYLVGMGAGIAPIIVFAYNIYEIIFAGVVTFLMTRKFYPLQVPFQFEQAYNKGEMTKKLVNFLVFSLTVLGMTGFLVMVNGMKYMAGYALIVFFVLDYMYIRLKNWGVPQPTFREFGADVKSALKDLKKEVTYIPLKKDKGVGAEKTAKKTATKTTRRVKKLSPKTKGKKKVSKK